ncbi:MAG: DUF2490 domain-containing protein [Bacteroidota bacterium]
MGGAKQFPFFIFFIAFFTLTNTTSYGQGDSENRSGSWLVLYGTNKVHEKWSVPLVGILRHHDMFEKYEFAFVRTGLSYKINNSSALTAGVAYLSSKNYTGSEEFQNATQFWVYEEYSLKSKSKRNKISHRWRFETRWKKNANNVRVNNRLRYRFQFIRPLYKNVHFRTFNEFFINIEPQLFNQNRFYIGLGQTITPSLKVDIGYLKNHFDKSDHDVVRMSLTFKTDFTKKDMAHNTAE